MRAALCFIHIDARNHNMKSTRPSHKSHQHTPHTQKRDRIYDALLSLVVSAQQEAPATPPRLTLATMGALAAVVAGDAAFEARVFERRCVFRCVYVESEARPILHYSRLLSERFKAGTCSRWHG